MPTPIANAPPPPGSGTGRRRRIVRFGGVADGHDVRASGCLSRSPDALTLTIGAGEEATAFRFSRSAPDACLWLRHSCRDKFHEPGLSEVVIDFFRRHPSATFFDVGSLYGYFALLAFAVSKGRGHIYAFEMNPESFAALSLNFAANRKPSAGVAEGGELVAVHAAVGAASQKARLTSYSHFHVDSTMAEARVGPIDFVTIDSFCKERGLQPDLIKIDVEGYEGQILAGAGNTLQSSGTVILLEFHSNALLGRYGSSRFDFLSSVLDSGARIYFFGHHRKRITDRVTSLSRESLLEHRNTIDSRRNELVAICRSDIRNYWPHLTVVEEMPVGGPQEEPEE